MTSNKLENDVYVSVGDDLKAQEETIYLSSIPGFRKSIAQSVKEMKKGETVSMDEAFESQK